MREKILKFIGRSGGSFDLLADVIEGYSPGNKIKDVYIKVGLMRNISAASVEKRVACAVGEISAYTPKAYVARVKERIMFDQGE